jgi:hypothetical protein
VRREHLCVVVHNRLWWPLARRLVRVVDFGDGTYAIGWRWRRRAWLVEPQ